MSEAKSGLSCLGAQAATSAEHSELMPRAEPAYRFAHAGYICCPPAERLFLIGLGFLGSETPGDLRNHRSQPKTTAAEPDLAFSLWRGGHSDRKFRAQAVMAPAVSCNCLFLSQDGRCLGRGTAMTKLGIFAATILAAAGACCGVEARAADAKTCTGLWDFIETDCQLTWYGITLYGVIDAGFTYQTHGAPLDPRSPPGSAYIVQRYSRSSRWDLAPNGLQNSFIGIKGTEPIGGNTSVVFALDAGFDPYSFKLSNGPGSAAHNAGVPQNQQTSWADSSRAGQWYNGNGYVGLSSPTYGTLTVFRQNSLTYDGVLAYDPMGASYAFSPIGWQGLSCGGGNTENCRHTTSLKYRLNIGQARVAAIWQFGGYGQNNASNGAYQVGVGGDIFQLPTIFAPIMAPNPISVRDRKSTRLNSSH